MGGEEVDGGRHQLSVPVPRWSLRCDRRELPSLASEYAAGPEGEARHLLSRPGTEVSAGVEEQLLMLRHEAEAWRLVQALWEHIEGEEDGGTVLDEGDGGRRRTDGSLPGEDSGFMGPGQAALIAFRRRRAIGLWLKRQAKALTEEELTGVSEPAEAVLRLLCAQQAAGAAAVAVSSGDLRLATLVAQAAGPRSETTTAAEGCGFAREAREQLAVWERNDMLGHISQDRLLCYRLLAGQVGELHSMLSMFSAACMLTLPGDQKVSSPH